MKNILRPISDKIICRKINEVKKLDGIILPENWKKKEKFKTDMEQMEVLAVGTKCSQPISAGDIIACGAYNLEPYTIDGEELFFVEVKSVHMIFNKVVNLR